MSQKPRRLRIALVTDTANSISGSGAVVSGQLLAEQLRQNHDVVVVSSDSNYSNVKLRSIQPPFVAVAKHLDIKLALPNRKKLRKAFADVDIVHLHLPFWLSFVALDEARKAGKPVVASFHVQPENILHNLHIRSSWLNKKIYQFWIKYFWNRADLVMCPTPFAVRKLQKYNLRTRAVAISNGISFENSGQIFERDEQFKDYFLIFMLGRLTAEKEQHVLIEAVRRSKYAKKIKIVIAGKGQKEKKLRQLSKNLINAPEIGFVSEERKNQLLNTADLFVHCSSVELEGMAVLEAMGAGLPVLVAEGPETAAGDLALDHFRFPVGNVEALKQKIEWMIENPEELAKAKETYLELAQKLCMTNSIKDIEQSYLSLV